MSNINLDIGKRLNVVRTERLQFTQEILSEKCGISVEFYRLLEKGDYLPNLNVLKCIHDLGGDVDYILTGIEAKSSVFENLLGNISENRRDNICNLLIFQMKTMLHYKDSQENMVETFIRDGANIVYTPDDRIREIILSERNFDNITNVDIAADLNKSKKTISRWLNGKSELKTEMVLSIYNKYEYFPSYILYGEMNSNSKVDKYYENLMESDKKKVMKFAETLLTFM